MNGLSPVWVRLCFVRLPDWVNALPHTSHLCGFVPVWISRCFLKFPRQLNILWHTSHSCCFLVVCADETLDLLNPRVSLNIFWIVPVLVSASNTPYPSVVNCTKSSGFKSQFSTSTLLSYGATAAASIGSLHRCSLNFTLHESRSLPYSWWTSSSSC